MIRITITRAAYAAIAATLPGNVGVEQGRAPNGEVYVWLEPGVLNQLKAMRGSGESYSDVIIRVASERRLEVAACLSAPQKAQDGRSLLPVAPRLGRGRQAATCGPPLRERALDELITFRRASPCWPLAPELEACCRPETDQREWQQALDFHR